jgi:hypothetical protein
VWKKLNWGIPANSFVLAPRSISLLGRVPLNKGQIDAIQFGMNQTEKPLIIHGPPGNISNKYRHQIHLTG